jgi:hypothetical protein
MKDIMSIKGSKITDVNLTKGSNEKKDSFDHLQLTLDDGRTIAFSSTDAEQDSTSCHWHIHPVEYTIITP